MSVNPLPHLAMTSLIANTEHNLKVVVDHIFPPIVTLPEDNETVARFTMTKDHQPLSIKALNNKRSSAEITLFFDKIVSAKLMRGLDGLNQKCRLKHVSRSWLLPCTMKPISVRKVS